jgi:hypothetical protein
MPVIPIARKATPVKGLIQVRVEGVGFIGCSLGRSDTRLRNLQFGHIARK